jgi:hypothetical protein
MLLVVGLPLLLAVLARVAPHIAGRWLPRLETASRAPAAAALSWASWRHGDLQRYAEARIGDALQPRALVVQLTNQLYYAAFRRSYMYGGNLVVGRRDVLYEWGYIAPYCSTDDWSQAVRLGDLAARIAKLRAKLAAQNVALVFLLTPSKATVLAEFLPAGICRAPIDPDRPRGLLTALLRQNGVPFIDGHDLAMRAKSADPLPPFPRGGTHWSRLVGARAAELLMRELRRISGGDLGDLSLGDVAWTAPPEGSDADLAHLLNLFVAPVGYPTGVAKIDCRRTALGARGGMIAVGGSFLGQVLDPIVRCGLFRRIDYYFYYTDFRESWPGGRSPVDRATLDWRKELRDASAVVLEVNESAIGSSPSHLDAFLDDALNAKP